MHCSPHLTPHLHLAGHWHRTAALWFNKTRLQWFVAAAALFALGASAAAAEDNGALQRPLGEQARSPRSLLSGTQLPLVNEEAMPPTRLVLMYGRNRR